MRKILTYGIHVVVPYVSFLIEGFEEKTDDLF